MKIASITDEHAPWKQRYRLHKSRGRLARFNHQRGLVISNRTGIYQLYAWNVPDGKLRQLTQHSSGKGKGEISSDGRYIYYLNDTQGDEIGHFVRVDIDTGEQVDLTPDAEPYSVLGIQTDCIGKTICYLTADNEKGLQLFTQSVMTTTIDRPNLIYQTSNYTVNPVLSYSGELVV
ncbi:unnamed protein product, partial [Didymodactylos carnosus]